VPAVIDEESLPRVREKKYMYNSKVLSYHLNNSSLVEENVYLLIFQMEFAFHTLCM